MNLTGPFLLCQAFALERTQIRMSSSQLPLEQLLELTNTLVEA